MKYFCVMALAVEMVCDAAIARTMRNKDLVRDDSVMVGTSISSMLLLVVLAIALGKSKTVLSDWFRFVLICYDLMDQMRLGLSNVLFVT